MCDYAALDVALHNIEKKKKNIKPEWTLESRVTKAALSYFGHVVRAGGMEYDVMLGRMNGARKRGRPRQRWLDVQRGIQAEPPSAT